MADHPNPPGSKWDVTTIFYFIVLLLDLLFIVSDQSQLRWVSKPMLMLILIAGLLLIRRVIANSWFIPWICALIFSWLGDVLLMFDDSFFVPGLLAFLCAHLSYLIMFFKLKQVEPLKKIIFLIASFLTMIYFVWFYKIILVETGSLFPAVLVYAIVILLMWLMAAHRSLRKYHINYWLVSGAMLFVISDSGLGYNKFVASDPLLGGMVMLTYGLAQYGLYRGLKDAIKL